MARPDSEERQQRRWLEDARKHLGRGDLEGTLSSLLRLPPAQREELLLPSAALFRKTAQEQYRRGAWAGLSTLAVRADTEPALVERGVESAEARATYWPLMWAAGRARDWARAERLWQPLADEARARAPLLAVAVEQWLSSRGAPSLGGVTAVLERLPPVDARLGIQPTRPRAALSPPRSVAEVEGALLALCALDPFPVFASRVEAWAREAPGEVARAVWEFAGQLAARELWLRAEAGKQGAVLAAPSSLLARAVRETGGAPPLFTPVLHALRVMTTSLPREGLTHAEEAEAWCALAQAVALYPEARAWVVQAVSGVRFSGAALPRALHCHEALLELAPDAALWSRAFLAWSEQNPDKESAPRWLQEGLRRVLATWGGPLPLLAWLRGATPTERRNLVGAVASTCTPELVEAWVEACWEGAEEELRRELSEAISILLDRTRVKKAGLKMEQLMRGATDVETAMRVLLDVEGALAQVSELMKLPPEGLRIWRRFASRVLPYRVEFLEQAVRHASTDAEAWEAAEQYQAAHQGDAGYVEVLRTMEVLQRKALAKRVLAQWLERRASDVQALAKAAVVAEQMDTPCEYLHPVLEAFLVAQAAKPSLTPTQEERQARALAREHEIKLRKPRAPRKKKEATKSPAPRTAAGRKRPRKKAPSGEGGTS